MKQKIQKFIDYLAKNFLYSYYLPLKCSFISASSGKKTSLDLCVQLLGQSPELSECIKYKELKEKHPLHASFSSLYNQWFAKVQIQVSKKYYELKEKINIMDTDDNDILNAEKKIAQKDHWGIYYY